jgi:serine/threonine protein kinase
LINSKDDNVQNGDRISEYILVERIGQGGFGEVWKAKHEVLPDKIVAVKIPTDEHYIKQLRSEGIFQHTLDHPNIVKTLGLSVTSTPPYFIMEYIEGESLRERIKKSGRLPVNETVSIIVQVAEALAHAHREGIVHSDIKPENILIDKDSRAMLTDFGLGHVSQNYSAALALEGSLITKEGQSISGTLDYMSPEQKQGLSTGPESDIYSLGLVLFEALTGELPQPQDVPSDLAAGIPPYLDYAFTKCFTRAGKRYKNASILLKDLRRQKAGTIKRTARTSQNQRRNIVEEPLSACLVVMCMIVGALAGFAVALLLTHNPVYALAGAGIGLVLGARILRPKFLIITLGGAIIGGVVALGNPVGALVGVIGAEIVATFIEMGKN